MPRLSRQLPAYRKHKATGQAVVSLGGKDHYLGKWKSAASKAEYNRVTREWVAGGQIHVTNDLTLVELLASFKRHARTYYVGPDGTVNKEYRNYVTLSKRLAKMYGTTLAADFGPLRLKAFRQSLVDHGLARTNINQSINRVRHIFKWAAENELAPASVFEALRCVAGLRYGKTNAKETEPVRPVPDAFVDATLPYCSPQVAAMIGLQRVTGMRSGEVVQMRGCDINMQGETWIYTPASHKTQYRGHSRIVYLGPQAQAIIKQWLRGDTQAHLFQPCEAEQWRYAQMHANRKTPISCGNKPGSNRKAKPRRKPGQQYDTQSYGKSVKAAIERCNKARTEAGQPDIPHWHPHQLRPNYATLARREFGLEVARVLLGHKHASITEVYAEADQHLAADAALKIG